jgi:hypothetical protein
MLLRETSKLKLTKLEESSTLYLSQLSDKQIIEKKNSQLKHMMMQVCKYNPGSKSRNSLKKDGRNMTSVREVSERYNSNTSQHKYILMSKHNVKS